MNEKIVAAVIGCGRIATNGHFPALKNLGNVRIKYACDLISEKAEAKKREYPGLVENAITDYRIALEDPETEVIFVLTPNFAHYTIAMEALSAGKHVFCEKPITVNYALSCEMAKEAEKQGKILNIGVCNRYHKSVEMLEQYYREGKFGKIYHVYCSFRAHRSIPGLGGAFTTKARSGGGALIDWGVHYLDLILYCLGDPAIKTVSAAAYSVLGKDIEGYVYESMWAGPPVKDGVYDVDDMVTGFVRTEGPTLSFNGAWAQNIGEGATFIEFMGDKGGIKLQYGGGFVLYSTLNGMLTETHFKYQTENMYNAEVRDFLIKAPQGIKTKANIDKAIITSRLMDMIYRSSELGEEVKA